MHVVNIVVFDSVSCSMNELSKSKKTRMIKKKIFKQRIGITKSQGIAGEVM